MKGWKEKTLSQAGKEILLKTVIQAMPSYAMSCFLLPITTCQDIERAIARFFWGSSEEERKCHWKSWDVLTTSKKAGGMGFRELHNFNLAMLAKQYWRLMQKPSSMACRILRAKYFPRTNIQQAQLGYKPSYLWRSLLAARELVNDGVAWRVGNGRNISIFGDRWIGVTEIGRPTSSIPSEWQGRKVDQLMNSETGGWNRTVINEVFNPIDAANILSMPISTGEVDDIMIWRFTKQGQFTVKSAYHRAIMLFSAVAGRLPSSSCTPKGWKQIWEIRTIPRVKLFLWRACSDALPVKANLVRRGISNDAICDLCGEKAETLEHLLLKCSQVTPVWYGSQLRISMNQLQISNFKEFLWTSIERYPREYVSFLAYLAWEIWNHRNAVYFEGKSFKFAEVIQRATDRWKEEDIRMERVDQLPKVKELMRRWKKPTAGTLKLNTDVAVWPNNRVGLGFIVRDHNGNCVLAGKKEVEAAGCSTLLEGLGMRFGLQMMQQYHLKGVYMECDNKNMVDIINEVLQPEIYTDVLLHNIKSLMNKVECTRCSVIAREANQVAHFIARGPDFLSITHNPSHVISFMEMDVID